MNETYTLKQVMNRLGLRSTNAVLSLERKYPEAFVVVERSGDKVRLFDKATLDKFAKMREYFRQVKP